MIERPYYINENEVPPQGDMLHNFKPPGKVLESYYWNSINPKHSARHNLIVGPVGSGKTTMMLCKPIIECLHRIPAVMNNKGDWVKKYKFTSVRETYRQSDNTVHKTFLQLTEGYPKDVLITLSSEDPKSYLLRLQMPDPHQNFEKLVWVEIEYAFYAKGDKTIEAAWKSYETTDVWFNEALHPIQKADYEFAAGRTGRLPKLPNKRESGVRGKVFVDSNMQDQEHWLMERFLPPDTLPDHKVWIQPPGLIIDAETGEYVENPEAENLVNLPKNYYLDQLNEITDPMEVRMKLLNQPGYSKVGKTVFEGSYNEMLHGSSTELKPFKSCPLYIYADAGVYAAAIICQFTPDGRWLILDELTAEHEGGYNFGTALRSLLQSEYNGFVVEEAKCDLAGKAMGHDAEEKSFMQHLSEGSGVKFTASRTNELATRLEAARKALNSRMPNNNNEPMVMFSKKCKQLRRAMRQGYIYERIAEGSSVFRDVPKKNHPDSDLADCFHYFAVEQGFGRKFKKGQNIQPVSVPGHGATGYNAPQRSGHGKGGFFGRFKGKTNHEPINIGRGKKW